MKILEISNVNTSDSGTDYLVDLKLSEEERKKIGSELERWAECDDVVTAHVWVENNVAVSMDLSVFDGDGAWEDCLNVDVALTLEDAERVKDYVLYSIQVAKLMSRGANESNDVIDEDTENDMER